MAFSNALGQEGKVAERVETKAEVDFQPGTGITAIRLTLDATVRDVTEEDFQRIAEAAKVGCPVSQALAGVKDITLTATLTS
jgi:osmotically inducible protein OsmC